MLAFIATYHTLLIGLIFMAVLGPAVGNYACSVVYRLPLGKTPFERHPFCGHCNADLKPKDLFPILSWLSTAGKCRYCKGAIPSIYTVIELACLGIFVLYFLRFGVAEQFLLSTSFAVFVIILGAIEWQQGWLSSSIYGYALSIAAIARTLYDEGIFDWIHSFFITLALGLLLGKIHAAIARRTFAPFSENWIWWSALLAMVVPLPIAIELLLIGFVLRLFSTRLASLVLLLLSLLLPAM